MWYSCNTSDVNVHKYLDNHIGVEGATNVSIESSLLWDGLVKIEANPNLQAP